MVVEGHDPEWPDKVMAGALLVTIAGLLGLLYVAVRAAGATLGEDVPAVLQDYPLEVTTAGAMASVVLGIGGYRYQSTLLVGTGIGASVLSVGMLGVSSIIGLAAAWPLVRSYVEGEETRLDHRVVSPRRWPDKAVMASVLLAAGGAVSLVQASLLFAGGFEPLVLKDMPLLWGVFSLAAASLAWVAARQAFYVTHPRLGTFAASLTILAAGFYVVGPVLGAGALAYLSLAHREDEFRTHAPTA